MTSNDILNGTALNELVAESKKFWSSCYTKSNLFWQVNEANPVLVKNLHHLTGNESVGENFFVPLSGKSVDPLFLVQKGHSVFAVEFEQQAIEAFAKDNHVTLHFDPEESLYYTADRQLKIYCGDLFECPIEKYGPFDCVWDRGAFIAIEYESRKAYIEVMQRSLLKKETDENGPRKYNKFCYLLEGINFNRSLFAGPPRAVSEEDMASLFGDWAEYVLLKESSPDCELLATKELAKHGEKAEQTLYLITPRV
ncbi:thiopurine S-methyltransferase-like [Bradysia coprophila]|uniref:thiopurine S-methyltransferase-like n=1 Tax=Bradysia coprophila TaxID=38358 RepID=UPI00187DD2EF|nr:thiopurine S-methyltransferase-like [Bradysia coprophila]